MNEKTIDARGLSCPEPVLMARQALRDNAEGGFAVAVSSPTARDNVVAFLEDSGLKPTVREKTDEWLVAVPKS